MHRGVVVKFVYNSECNYVLTMGRKIGFYVAVAAARPAARHPERNPFL